MGSVVVPIVPAAIIYDLGRGGDTQARPDDEWGYSAIAMASSGPVDQGNVGAGTGAVANGLKGGIGTASAVLDDGTTVAALVVVNAAGSTVTDDGALLGAAYGLDREFPDHAVPGQRSTTGTPTTVVDPMANTTIGLIATDAALDKATVNRLASCGHDGLARAVYPAHTLGDGDTLFALATGNPSSHKELHVDSRDDTGTLDAILNAGADTVARAVAHAMLAADTTHGIPSYKDMYGC